MPGGPRRWLCARRGGPALLGQQGAEVRGHQAEALLVQEDAEQVAGQLGVLGFILGLESGQGRFQHLLHGARWGSLDKGPKGGIGIGQVVVDEPGDEALGRRRAPDLLVGEDPGSENSLHMCMCGR